MGYKALFLPIAWAIGKKSNAVDCPSPCCHSPQGVMQSILNGLPAEQLPYGDFLAREVVDHRLRKSHPAHSANTHKPMEA
jgi:hypothetical protein